jgi:hypothetical protein
MTDKGEMGKLVGMARAAQHANPAWMAAAYRAAVEAARELVVLTTDDVWSRMDPAVKTHEHRAMGPIMKNAAKDGVIVKAIELPKNCARPSRHKAPLTVWKSLIYRGRQ